MKPGSAFRALLTVIGLAGAFIFENVRMLLNDVILEMISIQGLVGAQAATVHLLRKAPVVGTVGRSCFRNYFVDRLPSG